MKFLTRQLSALLIVFITLSFFATTSAQSQNLTEVWKMKKFNIQWKSPAGWKFIIQEGKAKAWHENFPGIYIGLEKLSIDINASTTAEQIAKTKFKDFLRLSPLVLSKKNLPQKGTLQKYKIVYHNDQRDNRVFVVLLNHKASYCFVVDCIVSRKGDYMKIADKIFESFTSY